jgi:outer membrane protein
MQKKFLILLLLLFITLNNLLKAQDTLSLTIGDCINIGFDKSKTLYISMSKVRSSNKRINEIETGLYPSVRFVGSYTRLSNIPEFSLSGAMPSSKGVDSNTVRYLGKLFGSFSELFPVILDNYMFRLTVQQPLFTGFRLTSSKESAEFNAAAISKDYSKDSIQLIYDIKNAYWSYFKSIEFLKSIDSNITQLKSHVQDIENLRQQGMATENDVLKVKVQLANIEVSRIDATNNIKMAMMVLSNSMGIPVSTVIKPKSDVKIKTNVTFELISLINLALDNSPELQAMKLRIKAGESGVETSKAGWWPQLNLVANANYANPNTRIQPMQSKFEGTWDIGVSLSYDVWNWQQTKFQSQQAEETLYQTKYTYEQLKDVIELDVSQSYLNYVKSREKIPAAENAVNQAKENYRVTSERLKAGFAINSDLLDSEVLLLQAEINYTNALVDYEIALAKIEKATGR